MKLTQKINHRTVVGSITASKDTYILIPGTYTITLYSKGHLTDVINLRIMEWTNYLGLSGWAHNVITSVFIRGGEREILLEKKTI